jgi:hypothetical protein
MKEEAEAEVEAHKEH